MFPCTTAPILAAGATVGSSESGDSERQIVTLCLLFRARTGAGVRPVAANASGKLITVRRDIDNGVSVNGIMSRIVNVNDER